MSELTGKSWHQSKDICSTSKQKVSSSKGSSISTYRSEVDCSLAPIPQKRGLHGNVLSRGFFFASYLENDFGNDLTIDLVLTTCKIVVLIMDTRCLS